MRKGHIERYRIRRVDEATAICNLCNGDARAKATRSDLHRSGSMDRLASNVNAAKARVL